MRIFTNHPTCVAFKKNERNTLEHIFTRKLAREFHDLESKIQYAYFDYKDKDLSQTDFNFHADFDMKIESHWHKVIIGARITGDYEETSYFIAVCGRSGALKLIRKFHFDHANPRHETSQPIPIFHLQYGGKSTTQMEAIGISDKVIETWLSVPRLNYPPITLALLLDILFCEFRTDSTIKILENPEWRALIKKNEELVICPYHRNISDFASSGNYTNRNLIRDFCYGSQ